VKLPEASVEPLACPPTPPRRVPGSLRRPRPPPPRWQSYLLAVLATIAAASAAQTLAAHFGTQAVLLMFTLPALISAYVGGLRAGLLAAALSWLPAACYLLPPVHSFRVESDAARWQLAFLALCGLAVSALNEVLHASRRRAELAIHGQEARKHADEAQRVSDARYRSLFEHAPDGIVIIDADGHYLDANGSVCHMLGYSREQLIGAPLSLIVAEHEIPHIAEALGVIATNQPYHREWVFRRRDATCLDVDVIATRMPDGKILAMIRDVTARKEAEAALRESESKLRKVIDGLGPNTFLSLLSPDGVMTEANGPVLDAAGLNAADVLGRPFDETYWWSYSDAAQARIRAAVADASAGLPSRFDIEVQVANNVLVWIDLSLNPACNGEGQVIYIVTSGVIIDRRVRAEKALLNAGALQNAIFNSANFSSIATDAHGVIQIFNVGAERMLGYAAADVMNKITPADISDPTEVIARAEALSAELETPIAPGFEALVFKASRGIEDIYELTYIRKDGSRFPAVVSVTALRDVQEVIIGYLLIGTDNTARLRVEEERRKLDHNLREQQFYTRSLIESNVDALMTADPAGIITDVNRQMEDLTGCTRDELIGSPFKSCFTDPEHADAGIRLVLAKKRITDYQLTARHRDGKEIVVSCNATTLYDRERNLRGVFAAARDITERKQYEATLEEATHKAEQANRAKSEFLTNMSHEIRTPMNAVIGLSYLLGQTQLSDEQRDFLAKVKVASNSLLVILNNVLDLSKIEAGELIVERTPFGLRSLLRELADVVGVQAHAKGIEFTIHAPTDLPEELEGDAARLNQILTNLLSNAIKFTERGVVNLSIERLVGAAGRARLCFLVQDTGIGIAPDAQAQLFQPFAQADPSIARRFGGTGIGLSIVKRLASLMGGDVGLQSTPGVGSEFRVVLEFDLAAPHALAYLAALPAIPGRRALHAVNVLVVDDSNINLEVTNRILALEGANVWLAHDGQEAFDFLQDKPHAIDAVLMDLQMPVLDGFDATRRIRTELQLAHLPIIALTAGALSSERQRATAAGMDDFVVKPFDAHALISCVLRHVTAGTASPIAPHGCAADVAFQPPRPWLPIAGIDMADAYARFSGDFGLFVPMLRQLLAENADVAAPRATDDAATLTRKAKALHKLKGCAGTLGAKSIQGLAGETEAALAAGGSADTVRLSSRLAEELRTLATATASALQDLPDARASEPLDTQAVLEPQALSDLIALLRAQRLSAVDCFNALAPGLRNRLGPASYAMTRGHLDNLRFGDAATILEHAQL